LKKKKKKKEPIICEFFIYLAKLGRLLTKTTVIELANDLIMVNLVMVGIMGFSNAMIMC